MKLLVWLAVAVIVGGLTVQIFHVYAGNRDLDTRLQEARAEERDLSNEQEQLQADAEYFSDPHNLAKELKAKFDYKRPGETLIKIQ